MSQILAGVREHAECLGASQPRSIESVHRLEESVERVPEVGDASKGAEVYGHFAVGDEEFGEHQHWDVGCWDHEETELK